MESDLRDELRCSICLNIYTDPVTLRCGHNFCRGCIDQLLNTQTMSGVYSCPDCRKTFRTRPELIKNITLRNVAERLLSTDPHLEEISRICCTYCVDFPVPAVKSCVLCEASLCDKHLNLHSKEAEHVLTDPSTSLENRKCPVHKKILKYYCTEDAACICVSCCQNGEHQGHTIESLDEASEKKKEKMRNILQKLITESKEIVQSLEEHKKKAQEKSFGNAETVNALFLEIVGRLDDLENRILSEISDQEEELSMSLNEFIQKLKRKRDLFSRKIKTIGKLCNMTDPLTVLQDLDTGDLCDPEEGGGDEDMEGHDIYDVDWDQCIGMLHAGLYHIITSTRSFTPRQTETKRKRCDDFDHVKFGGQSGQDRNNTGPSRKCRAIPGSSSDDEQQDI